MPSAARGVDFPPPKRRNLVNLTREGQPPATIALDAPKAQRQARRLVKFSFRRYLPACGATMARQPRTIRQKGPQEVFDGLRVLGRPRPFDRELDHIRQLASPSESSGRAGPQFFLPGTHPVTVIGTDPVTVIGTHPVTVRPFLTVHTPSLPSISCLVGRAPRACRRVARYEQPASG